MHATLEKFGYGPGTVFEDAHWAAVVRPAQPTLGSLVLIAKRDITSFGALNGDEGAALPVMVARIEAALARLAAPDRINYLMLMMVDPHVHFHVVPRYAASRNWNDREFIDSGWPGVPALTNAVALGPDEIAQLRADLTNGTTRGD
jgi:diadenosine tetraphosphate (Ap4A) HIT family hydrolase